MIYIVTSGEYSDYGIVKIFSKKELAEKYKELYEQANKYTIANIEEWEFTDESVVDSKVYNYKCYSWSPKSNILQFMYEQSEIENVVRGPHYYYNAHWDYLCIRVPSDTYTDEEILKICSNKYAELKYLYQVEGWTENQISEKYWAY